VADRQGAVEGMGMTRVWRDRSVFLTGHTGFKGAWLALWLAGLGARVSGYALPPATTPSLFALAGVRDALSGHHLADVRDAAALARAVREAEPEVVFHLAAQPLVRLSYREPVETWGTNVMGTVNLLEAVRHCPSVKAVVVVTTDKCYENREWLWGYRETDGLGGHDPYSASKAAAELVADSFRKAFFSAGVHGGGPLLATARAGNVIGGGDWSQDRLIPDAARAVAEGRSLRVRNPRATRPWQHVLESLRGYLLLAERLLAGDAGCADAFNFGPDPTGNVAVAEVLSRLAAQWQGLSWEVAAATDAPHEAGYLYLDSAKARRMLNWEPVWSLDEALARTASWYAAVAADPTVARRVTEEQLECFRS